MAIPVLYSTTERICEEINSKTAVNKSYIKYLHARYSFLITKIEKYPLDIDLLAKLQKIIENLGNIESFLKQKKRLCFAKQTTIATASQTGHLTIQPALCINPSHENPSPVLRIEKPLVGEEIFQSLYDYFYIVDLEDLKRKKDEIDDLISYFLTKLESRIKFLSFIFRIPNEFYQTSDAMVCLRIKALRNYIFFNEGAYALGYCLWKTFCKLYPFLEEHKRTPEDQVINIVMRNYEKIMLVSEKERQKLVNSFLFEHL